MSIAERDFNSFELGDSVYELAGGLIPNMAEIAGVDIGDEPNAEALGQLVGKYGKDKVLRNNDEIDIPLDMAADLVVRSGVQRGLNRALWTPHLEPDVGQHTVITGAVANWQDRTARLVIDRNNPDLAERFQKPVHIPIGNRVMNTPAEVKNPNIVDFFTNHGGYPTETEYAQTFVAPLLTKAGIEVSIVPYNTGVGDEIADRFVSGHPELFGGDENIIFARVANAGVQLGVQFRKAAQSQHKEFDSDPNNPNVFIQTDSFPTACTEAEKQNSAEFQSPFTGLRQVALTAKLLHEAASN